jgi:hypothetical protein
MITIADTITIAVITLAIITITTIAIAIITITPGLNVDISFDNLLKARSRFCWQL